MAKWFVGTITANDTTFIPEHTGRIDYGAPGISSLFAGKTGTSMLPPFDRRVLFGFSGWSSGKTSGCGQYYLLPRELSVSAAGQLQQHPVDELKRLRKTPSLRARCVILPGILLSFLLSLPCLCLYCAMGNKSTVCVLVRHYM